MRPGLWRRRMKTETRGVISSAWGVLAPVKADSAEYDRWAGNAVGEKRRAVFRFYGCADMLEDGVSRILCRGKRYLVLESRRVESSGKAVMTDAVLREE